MKLINLTLLALVALGAAASARTIDPAVPANAVEIAKRVQCGQA